MTSSSCSAVLSAVVLTFVACAGSPIAPDAMSSPSMAASSTGSALASTVFELTNAERVRAGFSAFRTSDRLVQAAQLQSDQMVRAGLMAHVLPASPLPNPSDRLAAVGYEWQAYAENIAAGQSGAAEVVQAWMQSADHRASILNATYTELGVGYARDARSRPYYTQVFGRPAP